MFDLYEEFKSIVSALDEKGIDYAVCGGLAMAVHGLPRATVDIDLLILAESLEEVRGLAQTLGFNIEAFPMTFSSGQSRYAACRRLIVRPASFCRSICCWSLLKSS